MTPFLIAALLQAAAAPAAAHVTEPAATPGPAPAPAVAALDADGPTAEGLASLDQTYHDSCEVRLYGEYDDMCSALDRQIRRYRAALAKAERRSRSR